MQKWEYLRLDVHYKDPKDPGVQSVFSNYDETLSNVTFTDLHNYINKLGSEGWEMVGERASVNDTILSISSALSKRNPLKNRNRKSPLKRSAVFGSVFQQ
jgi:hypothetical protein